MTKTAIKSLTKTNLVQFHKIIFIVLLICGFDFNVWKCRWFIKILAAVYCSCLVVVNIHANFACCPGQELSVVWSVLEFTLSVIVTLVLKNQVALYFQKLTDVDSYLRIGPKYYLRMKKYTFLSLFVLWTIRLFYTILYCIWFPYFNDLTFFIISQFSLMALDLNRVWRFILFDMMRYRLKMLRCRLEEMKHYNFYCYVSDFKTVKQSKIRFCLDLYKNLSDAMDIILPELQASLVISIVCTLPKVIINAYHILLVIDNLEPLTSVGFAAFHVTQVILFISAPCLVVEHYGIEVERMRLLLMHKLFEDPDETTKEEIELFLRYTELRPFRCLLWRVIPVNIALPLDLLNLCTTYVIVVINFTHLYG